MIKKSLINFFRNLKYIFTPLGTIFLGVLFGCFCLVSGFQHQLNQAINDITTITESADVSIDNLKDCIVDSFLEVQWKDPIKAIKTLTSSEWLNNTLKPNLEKEIENYASYASDIEKALQKSIKGYSKYISLFAFFFIFSLFAGFFITKFIMNKDITKKTFGKYMLVSLIDSIVSISLIALCVYLLTLWRPSIIFSMSILACLFAVISLLEAYIMHAHKKVNIKQIINAKTTFSLMASNIVIALTTLALCFIITIITNILVGLFIAIALIEIANIVSSLNAEEYTKSLVNDIASETSNQNSQI